MSNLIQGLKVNLALNLNSIGTHNYVKVLLLNGYIAVKMFDIVCISET